MPGMSGRTAAERFGWIPSTATAVVLAFLAIGVSVGEQSRAPDVRPVDALGLVLLVGGAVPVAISRWWPLPAYVLALTSIGTYQALGYYTDSPYFLGGLVTAYLAPRARQWWRSLLIVALAVPAYGIGAFLRQRLEIVSFMTALTAAAVLAGQVVAELRAASSQRQAEARAEAERRMLTEERLRIARELHDVISHSIATIGVQAGVAAHLLDEHPEQAREALLAIKTVSRDAMRDLRGMLGVLRQTSEEHEDREPAPGLSRLPELLDRVRGAGVDVDMDVAGEPVPITPATDLAAYRIVQEGLTNVIRHAPGASAHVQLNYALDALSVEICNSSATSDVQSPAAPGTHHGLTGLRERALALGGSLDAGPLETGGFRLLARLPIGQTGA